MSRPCTSISSLHVGEIYNPSQDNASGPAPWQDPCEYNWQPWGRISFLAFSFGFGFTRPSAMYEALYIMHQAGSSEIPAKSLRNRCGSAIDPGRSSCTHQPTCHCISCGPFLKATEYSVQGSKVTACQWDKQATKGSSLVDSVEIRFVICKMRALNMKLEYTQSTFFSVFSPHWSFWSNWNVQSVLYSAPRTKVSFFWWERAKRGIDRELSSSLLAIMAG